MSFSGKKHNTEAASTKEIYGGPERALYEPPGGHLSDPAHCIAQRPTKPNNYKERAMHGKAQFWWQVWDFQANLKKIPPQEAIWATPPIALR